MRLVHHIKSVLPAIFLLLVTASCNSDSNKETKPTIKGIWKSVGYGNIYEIRDTSVVIYNVNDAGVLPFKQSNGAKKYFNNKKILKLTEDSLVYALGITDYTLTRLDSLPRVISDSVMLNDPYFNFDVMWNTFNEQYAYFEIRSVNWDSIKTVYRSRIKKDMTNKELYNVLDEMIKSLNDGHSRMFEPLYEEEQNTENWDEYFRKAKLILNNYVKQPKIFNNNIFWGEINNETGYLRIDGMNNMADYGISMPVENTEDWFEFYGKMDSISNMSKNPYQDNLEGTKIIMDSIMSELSAKKNIILDLRQNSGGADMIALKILSYFLPKTQPLFTKKARLGNSYTPKQTINISPSEPNFKGKVYLLTSPHTASAAEVLVLASINISNITRMGSNTEGIFSDILGKTLPIGWVFGLSNEVYQDLNDRSYEGMGIPPHILYPYSKNPDTFYFKDLIKNAPIDSLIELTLDEINRNSLR